MPTTVKPRVNRIEVEFPEAGKVRVRLYSHKLVKEDGEDPVSIPVEPRTLVVGATSQPTVSWLAWVLGQGKKEYNRDDIEFDFPAPVPEPEEE